MHEHQIGLELDRGIQQRLAGSHSSDNLGDLHAPLDLQAIRAIIRHPGSSQIAIGFLYQYGQSDGHRCLPNKAVARRWPVRGAFV
ncbi:hypothetical protein GCM10027514_01310 [Azotobacter armeniacus]